MSEQLLTQLREGAQDLELDLGESQLAQLMEFQSLLQKWNKVYNLTSVRDPQEMLTHHLLDSLAAVKPLQRHLAAMPAGQREKLLDVGSGGGLPGVVFAICCPDLDVSCVDTVAKKAAFINQAAAALRLPNLHGIHARVETLTQKFDVVSCRAFASLIDFTTWSRQALADHAVWLAMKGKQTDDEQAALGADVEVFHVEQLVVPGLDADRCIVWMRPKS
ncbi:16S rRNA (guanine(527)-N(7))-methyltransferase RsmG [Diaphorobacter ruginosibacter]|uniref:Ribosomal RNA small subunit methyltransferase G n=1 Tax=Diaphorobacter ruginosibacter TaxID=1715720 RepID=A0A7G9RMI9_9BURK|nr:16S rRNA (guanine(527)-N(7))-methyltransferase RsmG [Diaphorobacter ruginosibacter]QNN56814.1 16S rRNA (guanine(527)-N(7))-methyltransferase RsmG [Diaphorobacter ruginosibacter]